ncbi:ABC transporter permease subunit [Reinekea blandensis]|uniref:ABC transporter, membrane spanning protein (Ribose) n=1 Tax=Reinekea blandensis MED297 TaxID=314283 RepID=A4BFB0_9GAMM|nr:sugar ABC transporter permease [Reinekea blandensis]EAR09223.1 ABC transporter, membrane spanning protein (ribose) [Reinekea sp. MED297] [Reinekea blandensis MED297]
MISERTLPLLSAIAVLLILYGYGSFAYNGFFGLRLAGYLLTDNAFIIVTAVGMAFVILSGGIDLSVGSMIAFICALMAFLVVKLNLHPLWAILISVLVGTCFGTIMGTIIAVFKIQPFIVTLAGMFMFRGLGYVINTQQVKIDHPFMTTLSDFGVYIGQGELNFVAMVMLVLLAVGVIVSKYTRFGHNVYAIGGDSNSAALLGVNITGTTIRVYALSGFYASVAGILFAVATGSAYPEVGIAVELDAISAVVLGGTLLTGGVGYVFGAFIGGMTFGVIQQLINFDGSLNAASTRIVIGVLLLAFILMQKVILIWARKVTAKPV